MSTIIITVVAGPATGTTLTRDDSSRPVRVGRIKTGNTLAIKDGEVVWEGQEEGCSWWQGIRAPCKNHSNCIHMMCVHSNVECF